MKGCEKEMAKAALLMFLGIFLIVIGISTWNHNLIPDSIFGDITGNTVSKSTNNNNYNNADNDKENKNKTDNSTKLSCGKLGVLSGHASNKLKCQTTPCNLLLYKNLGTSHECQYCCARRF